MQTVLPLTICFLCVMHEVDSAKNELDCGTTLFTNTSGVINLPRNTAIYPATVNCTYTISTTGLSHIWLHAYYYTFNKFLQYFQECDGLGVTIGCLGEGETELNPNTTMVFCRDREMPFSIMERRLVFIDCRALKLSIRSISFDYQETLSLGFSVLKPDELCGTTSFSAPYGVVSSPRLPSNYPKAVNFLYVIESDRVNSVVLRVDRLHFGSKYDRHAPCSDSWLMITCLVNGTSMVHSMADRKLCIIDSPVVIRFPACRSVLFNFSIGYTNHEQTGFTARYATGDYDPDCGNASYSGPTGVITSPPPSQSFRRHNYLNCLYSITGVQNTTISLTFTSFSLSGRSHAYMNRDDFCSSDWLTVSCLSDRSAAANISSNRKYCGSKRTPLKFAFPNCEVAVLNYHSYSSLPSAEFKVIYTVTETESDGNTTTDELATSTAGASFSTAIPVITANCEVGCEISKDGTSCDCPTTTFRPSLVSGETTTKSDDIERRITRKMKKPKKKEPRGRWTLNLQNQSLCLDLSGIRTEILQDLFP